MLSKQSYQKRATYVFILLPLPVLLTFTSLIELSGFACGCFSRTWFNALNRRVKVDLHRRQAQGLPPKTKQSAVKYIFGTFVFVIPKEQERWTGQSKIIFWSQCHIKKMQLDVEVSPPANGLQIGNMQIPKVKVTRTDCIRCWDNWNFDFITGCLDWVSHFSSYPSHVLQ